MSVPKKKASKTRTKTRASHHGIGKIMLVMCSKCKKNIRPHTACPNCKTYKGKNIKN